MSIQTIYWIATLIIGIFLLMSAYSYFFSKSTSEGLKELGFPDYFRIQLAILKIIAAFVLLTPMVPIFVKDWSYAGVGFFLITALVAHISHRDSRGIILLLIGLGSTLVLSRYLLFMIPA